MEPDARNEKARLPRGNKRFNSASCRSCGSKNVSNFTGEIAIHFPGLENIDMPTVWVFPEILVCLDCGISQFAVPEAELHQLVRGKAPGQ